jgi:addiction module HigA family antidote
LKKLKPVTPGELLREEFLLPMGISQYRLAKEIGVPAQRIGEIVSGKRSVTADTTSVFAGSLACPKATGCEHRQLMTRKWRRLPSPKRSIGSSRGRAPRRSRRDHKPHCATERFTGATTRVRPPLRSAYRMKATRSQTPSCAPRSRCRCLESAGLSAAKKQRFFQIGRQ